MLGVATAHSIFFSVSFALRIVLFLELRFTATSLDACADRSASFFRRSLRLRFVVLLSFLFHWRQRLTS
jgi:hypothetical protein